MTLDEARNFAQDWIESWNCHDLERILSHYTDDFEMTSPFIPLIMNEKSCILKGKEQVGNYWKQSLKKFPDLKFELIDYSVGHNSLVLHYISVQRRKAAEFFQFGENGQVIEAIAHYDRIEL